MNPTKTVVNGITVHETIMLSENMNIFEMSKEPEVVTLCTIPQAEPHAQPGNDMSPTLNWSEKRDARMVKWDAKMAART